MDALRGYGSSDDNNSEDDTEKVEKSESKVKFGNEVSNNDSKDLADLPPTKLCSLALKVCSAPEVVATVSHYHLIVYCVTMLICNLIVK